MERQWNDLRVFLEVTRAQSVPAAARALGLSEATIRRRIAALEAQLGVALFERIEGLSRLTRSGVQLLPAVEAMERSSLDALERLQDADRRIAGLVRLGAPDGISMLLLAPRLAELQAAHPDLDIEMVSLTQQVDLRRREADIAVVWERPDGASIGFRRCGRSRCGCTRRGITSRKTGRSGASTTCARIGSWDTLCHRRSRIV